MHAVNVLVTVHMRNIIICTIYNIIAREFSTTYLVVEE